MLTKDYPPCKDVISMYFVTNNTKYSHVPIFRISSNRYCSTLWNSRIDRINGSERVCYDFMICKSSIRATININMPNSYTSTEFNLRLESCSVTASSWIKGMNRTEKSIGIFCTAAIVLVYVGIYVST